MKNYVTNSCHIGVNYRERLMRKKLYVYSKNLVKKVYMKILKDFKSSELRDYDEV